MKKILVVASLFALLAMVSACGSSSTSDSGTSGIPTVSDLSQLPRATNPMAAASASVSAAEAAKDAFKGAATTGLNIASTAESNFNTGSSLGACNTFNVVKEGVVSATQADMILCYVQQMNDAFAGLTDANGAPINVYDGNYHIFNLNITNAEEGTPERVKLKITKDVAGSITDFRMWMCQRLGNSLTQNEYIEQVISGADLSITALGHFAGEWGFGWHNIGATGTMNADRAFTTKTITTGNWNSPGVGEAATNWSETVLTQTPASFSMSGYSKGSWSQGDNSGTYLSTAVGLGQMIGDTGAVTALAMGDGAVNYAQSGTCTQCPPDGYSDTGVEGWNGDTTAPETAADNDYIATAQTYTYTSPAVQNSVPSIAFTTDQTWNCEDDVGVGIVTMPAVNEADIQSACSAYVFNHNWINCYDAIGH